MFQLGVLCASVVLFAFSFCGVAHILHLQHIKMQLELPIDVIYAPRVKVR